MSKTWKKTYLAFLLSVAATAAAMAADEKPAASDAANAAGPSSSNGASTGSTSAGAASRPLWSWQPVQAPRIPEVTQKDWVRNPIDAFVLAKLEEKGLKPSPEAARAAFIRRATLDAWGVIPTPEEVAAFVNDTAPDAYEKLIDRLLASPHFGERQARRWLDLARYADTSGFQVDSGRPNNWRYRDYVINAFNTDKPYDLFLKEQIAGDELRSGDQEALIATGFLAGYPDNSNSRDLVQRKYQITTDITDTLGQAVLGTTIGCARCHNHKSDKLTQKDYYSFQAFFANTSFSEKIVATKDDEVRKYDEQFAKYQEATKEITDKQKALIEPVKEEATKYHKERYLTDSRNSVFKPENEWTPLDRWVNHRYDEVTKDVDLAAYFQRFGDELSKEYNKDEWDKWVAYRKLTEQLRTFDKLKPKGSNTITAATELGHPEAPPTYVFFGGNHERPQEEVQPAFPAAITDEKPVVTPTPTSSGRRLALANWIASPKNPLTARVYVNRVWNQYFGKGIVPTVSDFGKAGDKPTNPELLDYLADNFAKEGWSIKKLHRQILLSNVYRQASDFREDAFKADPDNKLLAVFPRQRLEAEEIRDSLLVASGKLVDKIGGPSVAAPLPPGVTPPSQNFRVDPLDAAKDADDQYRRSLYIITKRSLPYPLLSTFDLNNPQQIHNKRDVTTTPLQALTLINSDVVFKLSEALAARILNEAGDDETAQFNRLYQVLFSRDPDETEKTFLKEFLDKHEQVITAKASDGKLTLAVPIGWKSGPNPVRAAAFVDLVHTVANSNDFIYRF